MPQKIYERLCEGEPVRGLESLPIENIIGRIREVFPKVEPFYFEETCLELNWQGGEGEGAFQVTWSPQHYRVDCYGLQEMEMNKLIGLAYEFSCSFYDPQVGRLYHPAV